MTLSDITSAIPEDVYRAACEASRLDSGDSNYGTHQVAKDFDPGIAHHIACSIWDSSESEDHKLYLAIQAYEKCLVMLIRCTLISTIGHGRFPTVIDFGFG